MMNEITLQILPLVSRFIAVAILGMTTWFVAKFAESVVLLVACKCKQPKASEYRKNLSAKFILWVVVVTMLPFTLSATGLDADWISRWQELIRQLFSLWPIWMLLSVLLAAIGTLLRAIPKFNLQLKQSSGTSRKELSR